jgi:hypothetical protein
MNQPSAQEPVRLLDDPSVDPLLRGDLEAAQQHAVAFPVDAGLARFEQTVAGASTLPPGGSVAGLRVLSWFTGAAALVGGGLLAAWLVGDPEPAGPKDDGALALAADGSEEAEPDPKQVLRPGGDAVADTSPTDPVPLDPESVAEVGSPSGAGDAGADEATVEAEVEAEGDNPVRDEPTPPRPTSKSDTHDEAPPALDAADEARQLNAARQALKADPAKALALAEAGEEQFPNGALVQERRGYAILALVALDRRDEAERRAEAYLERWPKGALSRRIRDALRGC